MNDPGEHGPMRGVHRVLRGWRLPVTAFVVVLLAGQLAVGMRATAGSPISGDEPFYVLTTQSLLTDGDLDLTDEYATREYRSWWRGSGPLWRQMTPAADGRLLAPHEPGLALVSVPAFAAAGVAGVQRFLVVLWAAAMACAAVLARRYGAGALAALFGAAVVGAGAPGIVYASQIYPEGPAALLVAAGLLLTTPPIGRAAPLGARPATQRQQTGPREGPGHARRLAMAVTLTALLWLGVKYLPLAGVLVAAWTWRFRSRPREILLPWSLLAVAAAHYVWWHVATFGGLTPYSVNVAWSGSTDREILADHLAFVWRSYRVYGVFLDARFGLFRWLPAAVLAIWSLHPPVSSRRGMAALPAATIVACVLVATFASITIMGWWFPGRLLIAGFPALVVLVALGAQRIPRTAAVLGVWSFAVAAVLVLAARNGEVRLAVDPFTLGWPLPPSWVFPDFRRFGAPQVAMSLAWGVALLGAATRPAWRARLRSR